MNLYFAPHQDDELLTLGINAIISNSINPLENHVYLCTDGSGSYVRKFLRNMRRCSHHKGRHRYFLTEDNFVAARDDEFRNSCLALGYDWGNIHIPLNRVKDGCLTVEIAEKIIINAICKFNNKENIIVHTLFPIGKEQHSDHTNLGLAAQNLYAKGIIHELHLYIEPYCAHLLDETKGYEMKKVSINNKEDVTKIQNAINSYSSWNPLKKQYAIGYHSVSDLFDRYLALKTNYEVIKVCSRRL